MHAYLGRRERKTYAERAISSNCSIGGIGPYIERALSTGREETLGIVKKQKHLRCKDLRCKSLRVRHRTLSVMMITVSNVIT